MVAFFGQNKVTIRISLLSDPDNCYAEVELPKRDFEPSKKMTALLYVKDYFLQQIGLKEAKLLFDTQVDTDEEKVLRQGITHV